MNRLSLRALTLTAVVLLAGCASSTSTSGGSPMSAGTLDKIRASKTITLGYRDSSVPFSYLDSNKQPIGYSVDLCNAVVEDLRRELKLPDLQPKWVPVTVENRVSAVMSGTVDLECGSTTNTLSRQEQVDFSLTTFVTGASLLAMPGTQVPGELTGIRIAVIPGTTTEAIIRDVINRAGASGRAQVVAVKDHADGLAALVNKTADVYASDRAILIGLAMGSPDPRQFALLDRFLSYEPYALMLRRGDPAFRLSVNRALARLYRTGDVLRVYERWFGQWGPASPLTVGMYAIEGLPE